MNITEKAKMMNKQLYNSSDQQLVKERTLARTYLKSYNQCSNERERNEILHNLLGSISGKVYIEPPFYCDYGYNISLGNDVYMNFNCTILDCNTVTIGDKVLFGPGVQIYAATHPTDPELRKKDLELALPVTIGNNVWIGGNVTILPGVNIGDDTTIGAGSVVTKDIPKRCVAAGNPCKVIKYLDK